MNADTIEPEIPFEEGLADIWKACLRVEQLGIHDNFFELGGDSLLATQIVLRLQAHLQIDLTVAHFLDHPTLAQFSTFLQTKTSNPLTHLPRLNLQRPRGPFPLSFAQQRLWFLHQWEPQSSAYNEAYFWRIRGALSPNALKDSLQDIVDRHESFRTSFSSQEGIPVQIVDPQGPVSLPIIDLRRMIAADREAEIERHMQEIQHRPFSLTTGPLYRTTLLQLQDEDYLFLFCIHHILIDGLSLQVFFQELTSFYQARINGTPLVLSPLPLHYADYAVWQREVLQGEFLQQSLEFWRKQLKDAPPYLNFPTDFPRPTTLTYRGKTQFFHITPSTTQALKTFSQQKGTTLFMTVLAAFQILLWRYTGQRDILVGTPIGSRTRVELEGLIGFFANTLVYRTLFTGQPDFHEVLKQVRETCLDAYDHQELPFEKIVEELIPVRDPSRQPIFQVMFQIFHHDSASQFSLENLQVKNIKPTIKTAKFDLYCKLSEKDGSLRGTLEYLTDIFEPQTIERFVSHYQILLEGLVHDPSHQVSTLPLLTSAERQQILGEWNPTPQPLSYTTGLHHLVELQVQQTPDVIAIRQESHQLTYAQLNSQADEWAGALQAHGMSPTTTVALWAEHNIQVAIGILAILKAGGVVVPLDPNDPKDRIQFILQETQAAFLLTPHNWSKTHWPNFQGRTLRLSQLTGSLSKEGLRSETPEVREDYPLYILHTSGSTGRPKGVVMLHRALKNLVAWQNGQSSMTVGSSSFHFAPFVFDVAWQELFSTWSSGGTLILLQETSRQDPSQWVEMAKEEQVERIFLPTVALQQLADTQEHGIDLPQSLQEILVAGDTLQITPPLRKVMRHLGHCRLHNQYGPTETHVVTDYELTEDPKDWPSFPPIGHHIRNTQVYIFDELVQPVPNGVEGEVFVGGWGLALGYQGSSIRTAERFVPHPYSSDPGARLYRTGDRGRMTADGQLAFAGRRDHQIKLRGYRIELGEIEGVLRQHPSVHQAVALCREDTPGDKQLVAYVVGISDHLLDPHQLRSYLKDTLPEYMVPAAMVELKNLPVTATGKVDRFALPAPDRSHRIHLTDHVAPRTSIEKLIAEVWEKILQVESIGIHDNFFELGGHSLLATQVVVRLRNILNVPVTLRTLFDCPTVHQLAQELENQSGKTGESSSN